jgi:hypothetical protein
LKNALNERLKALGRRLTGCRQWPLSVEVAWRGYGGQSPTAAIQLQFRGDTSAEIFCTEDLGTSWKKITAGVAPIFKAGSAQVKLTGAWRTSWVMTL